MLVTTCPKCEKQLNLPETSRGKRVRCMGCQAIVLVEPPEAPPPPPPREMAPRYEPEYSGATDEPAEEHNPVPEAVPGLRCASCDAAAVLELPPNANSRKPGYVCAMCRTEMRPPGTVGNYYAAVLLGTVIALLGLGLTGVAFQAAQGRDRMIGGGLALAVLGGVVAAWAYTQAKRPAPIGAEAPPARLGFWLAIILIGLLLAGGGMFALKYVMQEMM